ncbi:serine/threonine-protein kinase [Nocardia rosealba]|uniref:serine/threonine-protein kinase n=1 Tax=Nocardia rosealba TaxID=2878563 RepID=UPI001CD95BFA|nr:protein kinase [Nocardia rosealba]
MLGKGGMGEVYEAYDTGKDRVVALKLLAAELAQDPAYQVRFRRESQAAAKLAEPHVIPIHDWGVIDGVLFIDMRLVPGTDLRSVLRAGGPLHPERAVAVVEQIAAALDAAHAGGLVHRDVKPANILVTPADFAYLADFGIAHTEGDSALTQAGMAMGSYIYMAPERFDAAPISHRADIYSLACVLHECLTGASPFPSASMSVLIRSHLTEEPPRPSTVIAGLPVALDDVIAVGMAKDPAERYPSAGALALAARQALASAPGSAPIVGRGPVNAPGHGVPAAAGFGNAAGGIIGGAAAAGHGAGSRGTDAAARSGAGRGSNAPRERDDEAQEQPKPTPTGEFRVVGAVTATGGIETSRSQTSATGAQPTLIIRPPEARAETAGFHRVPVEGSGEVSIPAVIQPTGPTEIHPADTYFAPLPADDATPEPVVPTPPPAYTPDQGLPRMRPFPDAHLYGDNQAGETSSPVPQAARGSHPGGPAYGGQPGETSSPVPLPGAARGSHPGGPAYGGGRPGETSSPVPQPGASHSGPAYGGGRPGETSSPVPQFGGPGDAQRGPLVPPRSAPTQRYSGEYPVPGGQPPAAFGSHQSPGDRPAPPARLVSPPVPGGTGPSPLPGTELPDRNPGFGSPAAPFGAENGPEPRPGQPYGPRPGDSSNAPATQKFDADRFGPAAGQFDDERFPGSDHAPDSRSGGAANPFGPYAAEASSAHGGDRFGPDSGDRFSPDDDPASGVPRRPDAFGPPTEQYDPRSADDQRKDRPGDRRDPAQPGSGNHFAPPTEVFGPEHRRSAPTEHYGQNDQFSPPTEQFDPADIGDQRSAQTRHYPDAQRSAPTEHYPGGPEARRSAPTEHYGFDGPDSQRSQPTEHYGFDDPDPQRSQPTHQYRGGAAPFGAHNAVDPANPYNEQAAYSQYDDQQAYGDHAYRDNDGPYGPEPAYVPEPTWSQQDSNRRSMLLPVLVGVLAVIVVAIGGAIGWRLMSATDSSDTAGAPSTALVPAGPTGTTAPRATTAAPTTSAGPVTLPAGAQPCESGSASGSFSKAAVGNTVTSCPFAQAVREAYAGGGSASGAREVVATSPVTGRTYTMTCTPAGKLVTCTGGENAVVYVY